MACREKIKLGELLIQQRLLTVEQVNLALEQQKKAGRRLGRIIVDSGYLTERTLSEALARQLNVPFVDLKTFDVPASAIRLLPETQARRFSALPLSIDATRARVGMADPTDLFAYDELQRILGREIDAAVVAESALLETFDRVYRRA